MTYKTLAFFFLCSFQFLFSAPKTPSFPHPIDIVYLWVDGGDPQWASLKNYYSQIHQQHVVAVQDACTDNRFFDHEELKYSLRSIRKFAPFIRHIYIITMNQRPKWLLDHPQITIVDHTEIFSNPNDLPTFNSQSLECHLHRVPGLAEHFIYFNDDVLLGKAISPYDFFTKGGKIKVLFERGYTVSPNPEVQAALYRQAWLNSNALLDANFTPERRRRLCHAPFALRKSFIQEAEEMFPVVFQNNSSHKFRTVQDFNLVNGLLQYIWKYQKRVKTGTLTNKMISVYDGERFVETKEVMEEFMKDPKHTVCIQDCIVGSCVETCDFLKYFFETLLPEPAPWEKEPDDL